VLYAAATQTATTVQEAPSSISGGDQLRAAVVLGLTLAAMALLVLLAARGARRRRAADAITRRAKPGA
jgi:ABC-type phosphate transport system permease subunit